MRHLHNLIGSLIILYAVDAKPAPYIRITETSDGEIQLQVTNRKLKSTTDTNAPTIWLSAVAHIGDKLYFNTLQKHLDQQALVLFEGVGFHPDKATRLKGKRGAGNFQRDMVEKSIQEDIAKSLGLVYQLGAIEYDRPNFLNSDMSAQEFMTHFQLGTKQSILSGDAKEDRDATRFMATLAGTSAATKILKGFLQIFGKSPKFQGVARLVLIETLGSLGNEISSTGKLPESMQKLMKMILQKRNKIVLQDLQKIMEAKEQPESLSIFYGAAHMPHLEARITKSLGYKPVSDTWLTCFSVRPDQQGLNQSDIKFVRRLVAIQIKKYINQ
ncbi:MAG: hypothetical protein HOK49_11735 [Opitutae bacterium]|nr:hypothetical protein [Opitutae bacterium]MBT5379218.1 hypothetical protein [Opitutae bacterium]MBT5693232.1 hypothetical protein [Opitutae bacterium]MBT6463196.1 hypothetical protein [Opitutae bacterium]MBT7852847.1 hypothetical protein [Opitutae bacterium]